MSAGTLVRACRMLAARRTARVIEAVMIAEEMADQELDQLVADLQALQRERDDAMAEGNFTLEPV